MLWPVGAAAQTYTIRPGDSLGAIAEKHGIPLSQIVRANRIEDPDHVEPGLVITLETLSLRAKVTIKDVLYHPDEQMPNSIFSDFAIEMVVERAGDNA